MENPSYIKVESNSIAWQRQATDVEQPSLFSYTTLFATTSNHTAIRSLGMDVARAITPPTIFAVVAWCAMGVAEERRPVERGKTYASPHEVFEAYRKASAAGDVRTMYDCWGPEFRQHLVFEAFFTCSMHERDERAQAALRRFGPDDKTFADEYNRQYLQKHGVDVEKMMAAHQKAFAEASAKYLKENPPPEGAGLVPVQIDVSALPPRPEDDEELTREVVESLIIANCRQGRLLCGDERDLCRCRFTAPVLSPLERLAIRGEVANSFASQTAFHPRYDATGAKLRPIAVKQTVAIEFRKLKDGWRMHSVTPQ